MEYRGILHNKGIRVMPEMKDQDTRFIILCGEGKGVIYAYPKEEVEQLTVRNENCYYEIEQGIIATFINGDECYQPHDEMIRGTQILTWFGAEGDSYVAFYDGCNNRYVYRNVNVIPIIESPNDDYEHVIHEFRRLAALTNDITISLLNGCEVVFNSKEITTLSKVQRFIHYIEEQSKAEDMIAPEICVVDRDLDSIEFLVWSKLQGTEYEEARRMRKRIVIDTSEAQERIYDNKVAKNWNTTNIEKEICLLHGEIAEFYEAYRKKQCSVGEELADVAIYVLGIAEILDINLGEEIARKIEINEKREYEMINGVNTRVNE